MIGTLRPQTDTRPVVEPQTPTFGLLLRDLQPLTPPDPLDPLVVDDPSRRRPQQLRDLAVPVAAVLPGQFDDIGRQPLLVVTTVGRFTLRRAMLSERRTRTTLGYLEFAPNVLDHGTPARGA